MTTAEIPIPVVATHPRPTGRVWAGMQSIFRHLVLRDAWPGNEPCPPDTCRE